MTDQSALLVYTDGACKNNPGPGGWAWVVPQGECAFGSAPHTTNQRMELTAVLDALQSLDGAVEVVSDSKYVVDCFVQRWYDKWLVQGWRNSNKKDVANRDLWEPMVDIWQAREDEIAMRWVKGHTGDEWNEIADHLASEAADLQTSHRVSR